MSHTTTLRRTDIPFVSERTILYCEACPGVPERARHLASLRSLGSVVVLCDSCTIALIDPDCTLDLSIAAFDGGAN